MSNNNFWNKMKHIYYNTQKSGKVSLKIKNLKAESFSNNPQCQIKWYFNLIWSLFVVARIDLGFQFGFHDLSIASSARIKICPVLIAYLKIVKSWN